MGRVARVWTAARWTKLGQRFRSVCSSPIRISAPIVPVSVCLLPSPGPPSPVLTALLLLVVLHRISLHGAALWQQAHSERQNERRSDAMCAAFARGTDARGQAHRCSARHTVALAPGGTAGGHFCGLRCTALSIQKFDDRGGRMRQMALGPRLEQRRDRCGWWMAGAPAVSHCAQRDEKLIRSRHHPLCHVQLAHAHTDALRVAAATTRAKIHKCASDSSPGRALTRR